jgi:hypothetical protein
LPEPPQANRKGWAIQAQSERNLAVKQEKKRLALEIDHSRETSYIEGVCTTASDFLEALGTDAVKEYLNKKGITHDQAEAALYPDRRRRTSIVLAKLEKAKVWD